MTLQEMIPGCFGEMDQLFALHPLDENRAFELLRYCRENNIGLKEVSLEIKRHLMSRNCGNDHISDQLKRVQEHFGHWLRA